MYSREIAIPDDVSVEVEGNKVKVSGSRGELKREFKLTHDVKIQKQDKKLIVNSESASRKTKALVGTIVAHIRNMIVGVTEGYVYKMRIVYSHFPMNVKVDGNKVVIQNFLGERTSRIANIVGNTQVKIEGQEITITGNDLEEVGATASNIEQSCRIVGYDRRRFSDGIYLIKGKK
ncbi:MAG: 50S ribosomal protein L6 [Candidatus Aenigmatarchaeota archaeon]|nr:50S ribosomal protein L6 [Candidatus Aenigmarchaeota archaeon]